MSSNSRIERMKLVASYDSLEFLSLVATPSSCAPHAPQVKEILGNRTMNIYGIGIGIYFLLGLHSFQR